MNRTLQPTKTSSQFLTPTEDYDWLGQREALLPSRPPASEPAHCLFTPMHYESGYAYPLIVWLHSPSGSEEELRQVMPLISLRNHVAVAPRGTICAASRGAFDWGESPNDIVEASDRVQQCIDLAKQQFRIHPERIFLAGYATGGTLAHRLGMELPGQLAGAISLGGPVPRGGRPLRNINQARQLPLLLSVSPDAETYSTDQVMDDLRLLHHAGSRLSLRLYPDGDGLTTTMLSDVNDWVMEQFCPLAAIPAG